MDDEQVGGHDVPAPLASCPRPHVTSAPSMARSPRERVSGGCGRSEGHVQCKERREPKRTRSTRLACCCCRNNRPGLPCLSSLMPDWVLCEGTAEEVYSMAVLADVPRPARFRCWPAENSGVGWGSGASRECLHRLSLPVVGNNVLRRRCGRIMHLSSPTARMRGCYGVRLPVFGRGCVGLACGRLELLRAHCALL